MSNSSNSSITALVPGGVVTTQNISTVIRPKGNNNSMQFVKIQTPELSKKAEEQIRVAKESNISKEKIKEVEEEWQNNLLNWKSKRRQQFVGQHDFHNDNNGQNYDISDNGNSRKIKTFAEMIEQRAKKGNKLNFHLERYIGSGDDEEYDAAVEQNDNQAINDDAKDEILNYKSDKGVVGQLSDNTNQLIRNNQLDSDCEAHSSISSGYNQTNSKSPSSSLESPAEIHLQQDQHHNHHFHHHDNVDSLPNQVLSDNPAKLYAEINNKFCDNNNSANSILQDSHSISVVASSETDQLNSTFKQGINKPPTPPTIHSRNGKLKPMLDVDTRTSEVSTKMEDVSDDSTSDVEDEDEQEEQEEQKQLQRIAFVAKLKAFERMTQPARQEPKFVPVKPAIRSVKASKPTIVDVMPKVRTNDLTNLTSRVSNIQIDREPSDACTRSTPPQQPQKQHQPLLQSQPLPQPQQQSSPRPRQAIPLQQQQSPPRSLQPPPLQKQQIDALNPIPQLSSPPLPQHLPPPSAKKTITTDLKRCESTESRNSQQQSDYWSGYLPAAPGSDNSHQHNLLTQRIGGSNHTIQSQPLPEPPKANTRLQATSNSNNLNNNNNSSINSNHQSPRKPTPRDDKDRTVLSVSGKKRCSSCKEELGRGAAAFVVESLSLVYHTNCFRCSVCHVNLSNGFRGVDVRVHAGALHCQNCYSKDGLNYSRV